MVFVIAQGSVSLSANGTGTITFKVPSGKRWVIRKLTWTSTGTYDITDIRDTGTGTHYNSGDIPSGALRNFTSDDILLFEPPIELTGPTNLVFDLTDTSGASNTVELVIWVEEL